MQWTAETINRLYEFYGQHFERLREDVIQTNRSLGSSNPDKTRLEILTRKEFESLLQESNNDPKVIQMWLQRIIRGHEHEFPELRLVSGVHRRATG
jgi:hypothetical protein